MNKIFLLEIFLCGSLLLKSSSLHRAVLINEWIVWNVGQGQWVTHIQADTCTHYDVGGEIFMLQKIKTPLQNLCLKRRNQILISHWDFDHYSFVPFLVRWLPEVCWEDHPGWILNKKTVAKIQNLNLSRCPDSQTQIWRPFKFRTTNESSAIYSHWHVLIPGDSPVQNERNWLRKFSKFTGLIKQIKILILGHHGSRTSTSMELLQSLQELKIAIASARYQKYRHPHKQTQERLKKQNVPILKTEDWGHIHIQN